MDAPRLPNKKIVLFCMKKFARDPAKLSLKPDQLKISGDGVFYTMQGEGKTMGLPACFLRLHLCNLRCSWCDTWYTWKKDTKEFWTESEDWSLKKTKQKIERAWGCTNPKIQKRAVITGGEPMLQKNCVEKLMRSMPGWLFEIETNGTIMPTDYVLKHCQFNCSPKLAHSKNLTAARINEKVLRALNKANTVFKFVVKKNSDLDEIEKDFIIPYQLDLAKIIVMPEGQTPEEVAKHARGVVEYAKKKGYRLLDRMHLNIWGAKRKV